jgi:hypothetical protein
LAISSYCCRLQTVTCSRDAGAPWGQPPDLIGLTNTQGQPAITQARTNGALQLHVAVDLKSDGTVHRVRTGAKLQ